MMRSVERKKPDRMLSSVVLPVPVPPEITTFEPALHDAVQHLGQRLVDRAEPDQVVGGEQLDREAADREHRAVERERRDDRVDARAVLESRIDHRRRLVDAPTDRRDDAVDDVHQVRVVVEAHLGQFELAVALDVDLVMGR